MKELAMKGGEPIRRKKLPLVLPFVGKEEAKTASDTIKSTWISSNGPKGQELEAKLAKYLDVKHVLLTNNCTSALHLALMASGVENREVIIPNYTFASTGLAPMLNKCETVLCEVEFDTANIDGDKLNSHVNSKTKAIIPVHYAGHPCDMDKIYKIAEKNNFVVIEDAAQALGSEYKGRKIGGLKKSLASCFSFHAIKNITCGEGGAFVTNDSEMAQKAEIMRDKGTNKKNHHKEYKVGFYECLTKGHNYMLSDILASIALVQFRKLKKINNMRKKNADFITKHLKPYDKIITPIIKPYAKTNWHIYHIRVPENRQNFFIKAMNAEGIQVNVHYCPLHLNPLYKKYGHKKGDFPVSENIFKTLVRLPLYPQMSKGDLNDIIAAIDKIYRYL